MSSIFQISNRQQLLRETKDYLLIALGMIMYAVGWTVFLLPNNLPSGAVPGIASVVYWATGFPVQYTYLLINFALLLLALKILGLKFCLKTIFAVGVLTFATPVFQHFIKDSLINDQPFMACVLGASFCGGGIGVAFSANGSTGGTDIIALVIAKYRDKSPGKVFMYCDLIIIGSIIFLPGKGLQDVVYGYIQMVSFSFMLDFILTGTKQSVQILVFSEKYEDVADMLINDMNRGVTAINSVGWYSRKESKLLIVVARKYQLSAITSAIREVDGKAFISVSSAMSVYGEGFEQVKSKHKKDRKSISLRNFISE